MTNYNFIEKLFCGRPIAAGNVCLASNETLGATITSLQIDVVNLEKEKREIVTSAGLTKKECLEQIDTLNAQISTLTGDLSACNASLNQSLPSDLQNHSANFYKLPQATQVLANAYCSKYPEAYVKYNGRSFGKNKTRYSLDVKAWLLQGKNDWEIVSKVKACRGMVSDIIADNPGISFHKACDRAYMRVTHALGDNVTYGYDQNTWGEQEFWNFASESKTIGENGGGIDCEDKTVYDYIGCSIAGIPDELLRLGAGVTWSDEGHCSNFYMASDLKFHHRNSTTNYSADKDVLSLPLTGDESENLNFKNFWFSANAQHTWNWFATSADKKEAMTLKDDLFLKFIEIFGMDGKRVI